VKIAYKHLLKFLVDKPSIEELSGKLFQLGHEHEIEDSIFDMEFTPNRGDCLSLLGISRDLNVFYKTNTDLDIYENNIDLLNLNFTNKAKDKCSEISFLNIEIKDQVLVYKDYLNDYFTDLKINKNNFFTDVSNFIAYEMGQPVHSYDFSTIDNEITLSENTLNSEFTTLLGNKIKLRGTDLIFTSNKNIINLAGVMGSKDTACTNQTQNALIECAYFKPDSIIGKAVKYNLHSDASHKFERGTDPECHEKVLRRFIQIVSDHVEITKLEIYSENNNSFKEVELDFDLEIVNKILGLKKNTIDYKDSLIKLGFKVGKTIIAPSFRSDIHHQNDLAEEFARVIGYDNVPVSRMNLSGIFNTSNSSHENIIKAFLVDNGFSEVINPPFCSVKTADSIKVDNPLDSNREYIRTNIIDSLLNNLIYNEKRQQDSIKLFEISDIYTSTKNTYEKRLAIIISGRRGKNYIDFSQKLDNKYLIELFKEKNIDIDKYILNIDRNKLDSKIKTPIFGVELKINNLLGDFNNYIPTNKSLPYFVKYEPISEFPSSYRDLSFAVKDSSRITEVINILSNVESKIMKNSFMFDFYENKKINESKIGFRFIFQSHYETLTDIQIDTEIKKIIQPVLSIESVSLPGSL